MSESNVYDLEFKIRAKCYLCNKPSEIIYQYNKSKDRDYLSI